MRVFTSSFVFLTLLSVFLNVQCTEFVPVYSWGYDRSDEQTPALSKMSQKVFTDHISKQLKDDLYLLVLAEQTLSPEDFLRNSEGHSSLPQLSNIKDSVVYTPAVQNPLKAIRHLNKDVNEISINNYKNSKDIPKGNILIVNLNDAGIDESRADMLKRHDELIMKIYNEIKGVHSNVLAIYTGHHKSWVSSENEDRSERLRRDTNSVDESIKELKNGFLYVEKNVVINGKDNDTITGIIDETITDNKIISLTVSSAMVDLKLEFEMTSMGYMELVSANLTNKTFGDPEVVTEISYVHAPVGFSYHCSKQVFRTKQFSIALENFQIQLFENSTDKGNSTSFKFGDAYDCVGFTSAPIWSGLFVTFILLFIMTLGLTMMMDIKTMDRFDDAKGKTITINASD